MTRVALLLLVLSLLALSCATGAFAADETQLPDVRTSETQSKAASTPLPSEATDSADPFVLLDSAKVQIGNGQLLNAADMLAAIPLKNAEPYVAQEILFQRMLLASAFLNASGAIAHDLSVRQLDKSGYAGWIREQRATYSKLFVSLAQDYLKQTEQSLACDFIRFRLPVVTAGHLNDIELYSDPQVLKAAVENWDAAKQGLGQGLIGTQARVALVLGAASFYDLREASSSIEGVSGRLHAGVPLDKATVLDWVAQSASQQAGSDADLAGIERTADSRLHELLAVQADPVLSARYARRNSPAAPPVTETKPAKHKSNKHRRKTSG